jgi:transposase InsO family protein
VLSRIRLNSDRGSTYTAKHSRTCALGSGSGSRWGASGRAYDNAASEAFFSTLEHEVLSRHHFATKAEARAVVTTWCHDFYNVQRRHSSAGLLPPVEYEKIAAIQTEAA